MAIEWPERPLGELVQNFDARRVPLSRREREQRRGSFPYYGATGIMDHVDDFLFEGLHLLVAEDGSVEQPDGKPVLQLVDGQFWVNNHAHVLRGATDEDTKYLYFALSTVAIRPYMSGSVQAKLSQANLNRIPTPYPEQEADRCAIAHILGTLDDKIELNRRMSETLEAMARALFKSWFVDFDPVRAKAEGRAPGLHKPLADLFPDRLVDSELGEIPEGWEATTLSTYAELNPESWSRGTAPETVRYIDLANTKWGAITSLAEYPWEEAPSRARRILRAWDTIIGTVRPGNGSFALVMERGLTGSTGFAVLRPRKQRHRSLVYCAATSRDNIDHLRHLADGAAYPAVRSDVVTATRVVTASDAVLDVFARVADPLLAKIAAAGQESHTLAALRDTLLPKLISGNLRLGDPERAIERVAG